jgi:hypothetical protein
MAKQKDGLALAAALADTSALEPFGGRPVTQTGLEIANAAGGLQKALAVEPREFDHGDEAFVVLKVDCRKVRFDEVDPDDEAAGLRRVHVFHADEAAFMDGDVVQKVLAEQKERIEKAIREAQGTLTLTDDKPDAGTIKTPSTGAKKRRSGTQPQRLKATKDMEAMHKAALGTLGAKVGVSVANARSKSQAIEKLLAEADIDELREAIVDVQAVIAAAQQS